MNEVYDTVHNLYEEKKISSETLMNFCSFFNCFQEHYDERDDFTAVFDFGWLKVRLTRSITKDKWVTFSTFFKEGEVVFTIFYSFLFAGRNSERSVKLRLADYNHLQLYKTWLYLYDPAVLCEFPITHNNIDFERNIKELLLDAERR